MEAAFPTPAGFLRIGGGRLPAPGRALPRVTRRRPMSDQPMAGERPWLADFATVFAHLWYQNFPAHPMFRRRMEQTDLTIHIGAAVRSAADLMGLFAHFESSVRTGAVLRDNIGVAA